MKKRLITIVLILLAVSMGIGFFAYTAFDKPMDDNSKETVIIEIPKGSSTTEVGEILKKKGLINDITKFKILSKIKRYDGKFKTGNYQVSKSMRPSEIAKLIISGKIVEASFTIPEGYNIYKIGKALEAQNIATAKEFEDALLNGNFNYDFLPKDKTGIDRFEGYLYPDTYSYAKGSNVTEIIKSALNNYKSKYDSKIKKIVSKSRKSLNEIMTIASIIERETVIPKERPMVSSVIYNRLNKNMNLQMCSTIQYILKEDKLMLTYADTEIQSLYNTYINKGLPPGPICNPGLDSIEAAANPDKTEYMYFVVSKKLDGSMEYSVDYAKFLKDKEEYYEALEKKGQ
ncbi:endolytic transglycosylase MltG [Eubacteriales bacterium KG127]